MLIPIEQRQYKVTFLEDLLGTQPANKELYTAYIATKAKPDEAEAALADVEAIEDKAEKGWTVFYRDAAQMPFLINYQVHGFFKEAIQALQQMIVDDKPLVKVPAYRDKVHHFLKVYPRRIYFGRDSEGAFERPIRAQTAQGPRVSLIKSDIIPAGTTITFRIALITNKDISWDIVETALNFGQYTGMGQFRTGGFGQFTWRQVSLNGGLSSGRKFAIEA